MANYILKLKIRICMMFIVKGYNYKSHFHVLPTYIDFTGKLKSAG